MEKRSEGLFSLLSGVSLCKDLQHAVNRLFRISFRFVVPLEFQSTLGTQSIEVGNIGASRVIGDRLCTGYLCPEVIFLVV